MKSTVNLKQALFSELMGSLFLLFIVNGVVILFDSLGGSSQTLVFTSAIAVPAILFVNIEIFGPFSGAHFNPLVSMIEYFEKRISIKIFTLYIIAQFLGGLLGIITSHLIFYTIHPSILQISSIKRIQSAYVSEIFVTFMLIFIILIISDSRKSHPTSIIPFLVGANILSSSSTMFANPMVTIARIFTDSQAGIRPFDAFIFILMQIVGAVVAYLLFKIIFKTNKKT